MVHGLIRDACPTAKFSGELERRQLDGEIDNGSSSIAARRERTMLFSDDTSRQQCRAPWHRPGSSFELQDQLLEVGRSDLFDQDGSLLAWLLDLAAF